MDIDAVLKDESNTPIGSIALTRDFDIPQAGQIQLTGNVSSAGASGKYSFEIENSGCEDVTMTGIGINETTTTAEFVSGDGSLFNDDTGEELITEEIPIDNTDPNSDTRRDMDPNITLAVNDIVRFEFNRFKENSTGPGNGNGNGNSSNIDMKGEDVRITLYFGDDSTSTIKLCIDGCDF
ncbi:hypothetical protein ACFQMM_12055 [Saliphagus sp. GCM10025308]